MTASLVHLRVWGDFACFTRPEMKVERVSYPIMTPSAARGILESIFWEPQMYYLIDAIRVVKRGTWLSFRRNEVTATLSLQSAGGWMKNPEKFSPIQAGGGAADGTQRNMLALEDVEYIISAEARLSGVGNNIPNGIQKYTAEFERRARNGKCYHRPCLGVREFAADFDWESDPEAAFGRRLQELGRDDRNPWPEEELGVMLYDLFDADERVEGFRWYSGAEIASFEAAREEQIRALPKGKQKAARAEPLPAFEGRAVKPRAAFFRARVRNAKMECHPERVELLRLPAGR
ncbi:MAG TPA: type I-C CRISPR-associated protein Cas5c [Candidatus Ozemobacteraceae bacterium]|mgnify:CR=1 FL=1|nr:type I-C CRISPR-associated protein Cas5c [Candidatus Ozemobacteraceae bacterium]